MNTGIESLNRIMSKVNTISQSQKGQNLQKKIEEEQKKNLYNCDDCKDTGYILIANPHALDTMKPCKCREMDKVKRLWKASGINSENLDKTFKNFETWNDNSKKMKDTATNYYLRYDNIKTTRRNSILLCGNPGSGKTHIALALANSFLKKKGLRVLYMPYRDIVTEIKQNILDKEYYKKILSKYQTCDVLLIDDLYKGKVNEADINIMFELINYRYLNHLPLIVSTEFTVEKLLNFDEAIGSRIYEMSKDFLIEIEGTENNYRLR